MMIAGGRSPEGQRSIKANRDAGAGENKQGSR
jgi:protocatechuate 4,5-dioxygenase alpha chain